ncbi:UNVERIFIED_CONTAM: hypothetical protein FKN15_053977 [Acipenser sinensis]
MEGITVPCLLDTGSQVTMLRQSFFEQHFGKHGKYLQDPTAWLSLRAANGLAIPYEGWAVMDIEIGSARIPQRGILVVQDHCLPSTPALLGMNIIQECWEELFQKKQTSKLQGLTCLNDSGRKAWGQVLKVCAKRAGFADKIGRVGFVCTTNRFPLKIPGFSDMLIRGRARAGPGGQDYSCLVEPLVEQQSLLVGRSLNTVENGRLFVRVRNTGSEPVLLHSHQKLGELFLIQSEEVTAEHDVFMAQIEPGIVDVRLLQTEKVASGESDCNYDAFDLSDVELSEEQRIQLKQLLDKYRGIFSTHEEDYGRTGAVRHQIRTGDAAPVRERYRRIPPNLFGEVAT